MERFKLTKRAIEALAPADAERIVWDADLKGLGIRVFPSGTRKFLLQYRNRGGATRRLMLGAFPVVTAERARELALKHLADVSEGGDPSADKRSHRRSATVADMCRAYLADAEAGLIVGRRGVAKKASTIATDRGRVERHIGPVLGALKARDVTRPHIERFKASVVSGKTAADVKTKKRGRAIVTGGKGTATRTLGLLGGIFAWGMSNGYVESNPVRGVTRFADGQRKALLTTEQYTALGAALDTLAAKRDRHGHPVHHPYGLAAVRFIALTGVRRGEAPALLWSEVDLANCALRFGDTKTGASVRPLGAATRSLLEGLERINGHVFPSGADKGGYQGLARLWGLVQRTAATAAGDGQPGPLDGLTLHSLRHSFAGTAEERDCSLPTIAAMLGHRLAGVTAGYVLKRLDKPLIASADRVARAIDESMRGKREAANVVQLRA